MHGTYSAFLLMFFNECLQPFVLTFHNSCVVVCLTANVVHWQVTLIQNLFYFVNKVIDGWFSYFCKFYKNI
jgi:hypothetical protein